MIETAKHAALAAAGILMENFGKITSHHIRVKRKNDFLTYVDEKSEQEIIRILHQAFPNHAILAEESGLNDMPGEYCWIIDPLDGTKNYISGIPVFSISIALQFNKQIILGVVYDPVHKDLFSAEKNKGAFLNNQPVRVSNTRLMEDCLFATGFPFKYKNFLQTYMDCFEDIFRQITSARRMGCASIDLAYVASGRFDAYWELGLQPWDCAAGSLLVEEAGGKVTDFWGANRYIQNSYIIASNGHVHESTMKIIQQHFIHYQKVE
jgi:myo-inositol-1(or 4)-monophosphatase